MKEVILNTKSINSIEELHDHLKKAFDFPDYYGRNLDAVYDLLSGDSEMPMKVKWIGFHDFKSKFESYAEELLEVFEDVEDELHDFQIEIN